MMKIWNMKKEQNDREEEEKKSSEPKKKKVTAAQLRVQKDLAELDLPDTMEVEFPDPDDIFNFIAYLEPDEGYYAGSRYSFSIAINQNFPHDPPKVKCRHKLYHPNIDKAGNVCLNILREDWKPVLNIHSVIVGLYFLLLEPNAADPLNKEAADELRYNKEVFRRNSRTACMGGYVHGEKYDRVFKD